MNHPEVFLVPIFMFSDYFLTVFGAIQREKKYSQHVEIEHYELNPLWQKPIARKKWFSPLHATITLLASIALVYLTEFGGLPDSYIEGILGFVLVLYGLIIGRHISNLLTFRHLIKRPEDISGQIKMSHHLMLSLSLYQSLMIAIPIILIALNSPTSFCYGGAVGTVFLLVMHLRWIRKCRAQQHSADVLKAPADANR